jgi:hypothetical protein
VILAAGKAILIVIAAADPDKLIHPIVIRFDIGIADRPGNLPPIALRACEIKIRVAERDAAPHVRFAAAAPHTSQLERLVCRSLVGLLIWIKINPGRTISTIDALVPFPRLHMCPELRPVESRSGVEHQHFYALARQIPCRHSAGRSTADDDHVMDFLRFLYRHSGLMFRVRAALKFGDVGVRVPAEFLSETLFRGVIPVDGQIL